MCGNDKITANTVPCILCNQVLLLVHSVFLKSQWQNKRCEWCTKYIVLGSILIGWMLWLQELIVTMNIQWLSGKAGKSD